MSALISGQHCIPQEHLCTKHHDSVLLIIKKVQSVQF